MKTVKQLREQLDFSQADMAAYLGITRSALAMSERGHPLNSKALLKFAVLEDYVRKATGKDSRNELPDSDTSQFARSYEVEIQVLTLRADLQERKVEELDELYEKNHHAYVVLCDMWEDGKGDPRFVNAQKLKVDAKLRTCSEKVRKEMRDQVTVLRSTADTYRKFLADSLVP